MTRELPSVADLLFVLEQLGGVKHALDEAEKTTGQGSGRPLDANPQPTQTMETGNARHGHDDDVA